MEQQKKPVAVPLFPGAIPMVRIDGGKVRRLRESKGLTQLYLSTVVGVTTDTISRWENRHYQSIKLDNAEKLAGALDVGLDAILEQSQSEPEPEPKLEPKLEPKPEPGQQPEPQPEAEAREEPRPGRQRAKWLVMAAAASAAAVVVILLFALFPEQPQDSIFAQRTLPPHAAPGQTFPVLIRVHHFAGQDSMSVIIKETIPAGNKILQGVPDMTTVDRKDNSLKWISRAEPGESVYAYLCQVHPDAAYGETLSFGGTVTRKLSIGEHESVAGAAALTVAPFHWADTNSDQMIDDEEILAVYDLYSDIKGLDFDRDRIDSIWAGGGYRWDEKKKNYLVLE